MSIMDIIAKETGGERQYSDQYAISYKGSHYAHRQQTKPELEKEYKAEFGDEEFELFSAKNDDEAMTTAFSLAEEHEGLFNVFEINENYDEIRTIF